MQESIKDQEDKNKQVVSEAQTLMSKKKETELLVSKLEEKIDALSEGSRSSENKMQICCRNFSVRIENKDNAETLQSKNTEKRRIKEADNVCSGEHAALVLGIQQERDGKEISLKAAHSEELKCAKLQAENEMREKIMEVRTEHEVQMKALTCQHEDECRKLQEELDSPKNLVSCRPIELTPSPKQPSLRDFQSHLELFHGIEKTEVIVLATSKIIVTN
uniref:Uncharacterized protein n=1 Tax=Salix viminalis TaxID=40686 RepID=A0A6N2MGB2_SALVM